VESERSKSSLEKLASFQMMFGERVVAQGDKKEKAGEFKLDTSSYGHPLSACGGNSCHLEKNLDVKKRMG